jgi:hypothetical protein
MAEEKQSLALYGINYTHAKSIEEKNSILSSASLAMSLSIKDTHEILTKERSKIQSIHIKEISELSRNDNDTFIEKYKIKEKIPQDKLPCVFSIDMFGNVQYSNKGINDLSLSTKNLRFITKLDENYKCIGFRA